MQVVLSPDGDGLVAHARLIAERTLAGQAQPQRTVHFTGTVRLARTAPAAETARPAAAADGAVMTASQVYAFYFHGPGLPGRGLGVAGRRQFGGGTGRSAARQPPAARVCRWPPPRGWSSCASRPPGCGRPGSKAGSRCPAHVGSARMLRDPATATGALHATARQIGAGPLRLRRRRRRRPGDRATRRLPDDAAAYADLRRRGIRPAGPFSSAEPMMSSLTPINRLGVLDHGRDRRTRAQLRRRAEPRAARTADHDRPHPLRHRSAAVVWPRGGRRAVRSPPPPTNGPTTTSSHACSGRTSTRCGWDPGCPARAPI